MNFSVVLIARNEAKTLPLLMGSLKEFQERGGEVVLVDTGSTDGTASVATGLGCRVVEVGDMFRRTIDADTAWSINDYFVVGGEKPVVEAGQSLFDYAAARNFAASLALNDMVAMPDCDEMYSKLDLAAIEAAIASGVEQLEYNFVFSHDAHGNEAIKFMHSKFYDRRKMHWEGIVHEVLRGEAKRQFLGEDVIKLEHYQNQETNRGGYLTGLALDCFQNPTNDRNSHYLGRELLWTGRPKSALKELARHEQMLKWDAERSQSFIFMGDAFLVLGDETAAVGAWESAIKAYPNRREPYIRLALHARQKDDHVDAKKWAEKALSITSSGFYADNQAHYRETPHEILYWAEWYLGNKEKSKEHWQKCLEYVPHSHKYLHDARFYEELPSISVLLPTLGRVEGLKRAVKSIKELNYPQDRIEIVVDPREEPTVPVKVRDMLAQAKGEWLMFASNDIEFDFNSLIKAVRAAKSEGKRLVAFNTGPVLPDEGNICEHFLIARSLIPEIGGEIFDTEFTHVGCDNLLWAKASAKGEAMRCPEATAVHHHFSKDSKYDWVYERGWKNAEKDRALLKSKLYELSLLQAQG